MVVSAVATREAEQGACRLRPEFAGARGGRGQVQLQAGRGHGHRAGRALGPGHGAGTPTAWTIHQQRWPESPRVAAQRAIARPSNGPNHLGLRAWRWRRS